MWAFSCVAVVADAAIVAGGNVETVELATPSIDDWSAAGQQPGINIVFVVAVLVEASSPLPWLILEFSAVVGCRVACSHCRDQDAVQCYTRQDDDEEDGVFGFGFVLCFLMLS
jgi:hypothetical protein